MSLRMDRSLAWGLLSAVFFTACQGDTGPKGDPGAAGAAGAVGPAGAAGPQGPAGTSGQDGADGDDGADGQVGLTGPQGLPGNDADPRPARLLDQRVCGWVDAARSKLNELLVAHGRTSTSWDPARRPVAVFDWDNTVIKNDIGDATLFWMLMHDEILQPPDRDWTVTNRALTAGAVAALKTACDALAEPGEKLPTSTSNACASAIVGIYTTGAVPGGTARAFSPEITVTNNNPYTWVAQLLAGQTPDEARAIARAAFEANASNAIGSTQAIGTVTGLNAYVRVYEPIRDLAASLEENGFDIWILSASPQYVVEAVSDEIGVPRDRVIGIRTVQANGIITPRIQGCGDVADGEDTLITFDEGKRCWINKAIFHRPVLDQRASASDPALRPVFVAGDSDTDIAMLKDATALKLVINRAKTQIMCNAYANRDDSWIVQPMFISPRAQRSTPFPCTTAVDANGNVIVDEAGQVFTQDYADAVFALPTCN